MVRETIYSVMNKGLIAAILILVRLFLLGGFSYKTYCGGFVLALYSRNMFLNTFYFLTEKRKRKQSTFKLDKSRKSERCHFLTYKYIHAPHTHTHTHTHQPHTTYRTLHKITTTFTTQCKLQNKCSFVCVHISKCPVGRGNIPPVQVAVGSNKMETSHTYTLQCAN